MTNKFLKNLIKFILLLLAMTLPTYIVAAEDSYSSELVNQSNHAGLSGVRLVKSKLWPSTPGCLIDTGKAIVNPGESTVLKIKKAKECEVSGVGYEIYPVADTKKEHLLGYLSHRFEDARFTFQVARICDGTKCVFTDESLQSKTNTK